MLNEIGEKVKVEEIVEVLKKARVEKGVSYDELAEAMSLTRKQSVAQWLQPKHKNTPTMRNLIPLAICLGHYVTIEGVPIQSIEHLCEFVKSSRRYGRLAKYSRIKPLIDQGIAHTSEKAEFAKVQSFEMSMDILDMEVGIREMTDKEIEAYL